MRRTNNDSRHIATYIVRVVIVNGFMPATDKACGGEGKHENNDKELPLAGWFAQVAFTEPNMLASLGVRILSLLTQ